MATIASTLVGKTDQERAAAKAKALASTTIKMSSIIIDGYTIKITKRSYNTTTKMLVLAFTVKDSAGRSVDLGSPYQYYNPPIMVFDSMIDNPRYPDEDDRAQIESYKEDLSQALREIFTDTIRAQIKARIV